METPAKDFDPEISKGKRRDGLIQETWDALKQGEPTIVCELYQYNKCDR